MISDQSVTIQWQRRSNAWGFRPSGNEFTVLLHSWKKLCNSRISHAVEERLHSLRYGCTLQKIRYCY